MRSAAFDVLIIGAGVSGLAAANTLSSAGHKVLVCEARNRIGGRVHTLHSQGMPVPVERGAEFIHGRPKEIWDIVRRERLSTTENKGDNVCFNGQTLRKCNEFWSQWEHVSEKMTVSRGQDESFLSFIRRLAERECLAAEVWQHAIEFVEGFNASDASQISLRSLIEDRDAQERIDGHRIFHLNEGYDRVVRHLASRVTIRKSTIIKEIYWRAGNVRIQGTNLATGAPVNLDARAAVITVPITAIHAAGKQVSIRFVPKISQKVDAARALKMGNVVKAILRFDEPFWLERGGRKLSFLHAEDQPLPVFWTTAPSIPVLTGWAGGKPADALSGQSSKRITSLALKSLAACFDMSEREMRRRLKQSFVADWKADPFAAGAYSYPPSGHTDARNILAEPIADTLFFAGEATNTEGYAATVHGAIATGRRAAREVAAVLKQTRGAA